MTPSEKAKELIERFKTQFSILIDSPDRNEAAKQCALICVEEIFGAIDWNEMGFWEKVKAELEEL